MSPIRCLGLAIVAMTISAGPAWSQGNGATVDEGLESAFLYVDVQNGNDNNPGTPSQPLQTIGAASSIAQANSDQGIGTRVIINPGIYRESLTISGFPTTSSAPVTFEAALNGTVIVSGAQQYSGWQVYSGNNGIYTHSWSYAWGLCPYLLDDPPAPDVVMRREMVFFDGWPLTQVMSLSAMNVATFYVDETGGTIYIWPPDGANVNAADIEVAIQPAVWTVSGSNYLVMRGLTFGYANSCRENGAVMVGGISTPSSNIEFDSDSFRWNNAQGLNFQPTVSNFTVQNSTANHNGESGFQVTMVTSGLMQSDEASFNDWRGAQGIYYNYNSGGAHFYQMHHLTINDLSLFYNLTYGTHFDTDNADVNITNLVASQNLLVGALIERNEGPFTFTDSSFCNGNPLSSSLTNVGLDIRTSQDITITASNFVGNAYDFFVNGYTGGFWITNWETGQDILLHVQDVAMSNNVFVNSAGQTLFADPLLDGSDWTDFQTTFTSDYNTWWNASNSEPFTVPVPKTSTRENFQGFQGTTMQDQHSVFQAPSGNPAAACWEAPDMVDYWFLAPYNTAAVTVNAGQSASWTASVVPLRFNGTVQLSYDGIQYIPGATAAWSVGTISPNGTSTFTVTTSSSTPPGTYQVTMIGTSGGLLTRTIAALLIVQ
ncbi:MAG TPA: right-handed parallel beta-helix repeat-containing protein [Terriglobia bacterium]|nr:right-handed parallel beta-helix repeat-containing protein [Terriglobia bacterium]